MSESRTSGYDCSLWIQNKGRANLHTARMLRQAQSPWVFCCLFSVQGGRIRVNRYSEDGKFCIFLR